MTWPAHPSLSEDSLTQAPVDVASVKTARTWSRQQVTTIGVVAAGVIGLVVLAIVVLGGDSGAKLATDYITKLAARDATAADLADVALVDSSASLGVLGLPASVTFTVEAFEATTAQVDDTRSVTASWTLTATGPDGLVSQADQSLSATIVKTPSGDRLENVMVSPPIGFDPSAYFQAGTGSSDAQRIADDLRAGNAWIPGVTVAIEPTEAPVPLDDIETSDPLHLVDWRNVVSEGVIGVQTTWTVSVSSDGYPIESISAATAVTTQPVAAHIVVGSMTMEGAATSATNAAREFDGAIAAGGDVTGLLAPGSPSMDAAALVAMAEQLPVVNPVDPSQIDTSGAALRAHTGDLELVMVDGRWLVDGNASHLVTSFIKGSGTYGWTQGPSGAWIDFSGCTTKATVKASFLGVTFWSDQSAVASFQIASSGDSACDRSPGFTIAASWPGNKAGTSINLSSSEPGQTVVRTSLLPANFDRSLLPLTLHVTRVGDVDVDEAFTAAQ